MSKEIEYREVRQKNGVIKRVPTTYRKRDGKKKTVSMTLPVPTVVSINQLAETHSVSKSEMVSRLLNFAIESESFDGAVSLTQ